MNGNRKRPDPGKKVFNKSAATAPTAVLKVRKTPEKQNEQHTEFWTSDKGPLSYYKQLLLFE